MMESGRIAIDKPENYSKLERMKQDNANSGASLETLMRLGFFALKSVTQDLLFNKLNEPLAQLDGLDDKRGD